MSKRKDPEEQERCLIGSILSNPKKYLDSCLDAGLNEEAFMPNRPPHLVFVAMMELKEKKKSMDIISIMHVLEAQGTLGRAGGSEGVHELLRFVPTGANWDVYLDLVLKDAAIRHARYEMEKLSEGLSTVRYREEVLDLLASAFKKPMSYVTPTTNVETDKSLLLSYVNAVEDRANGTNETVFSTPFETLNNKAGGTGAGEVTGIVAQPSAGKSILGKQFALHNLIEHGMPTMIVTGEMPYQQWMDRAVCEIGRIDFRNFRMGRLTDQEQKSLVATITKIAKLPLYVYDRKRLRMERPAIEAAVRAEAKRNGVKCLLLDYLQLVKSPNGKKDLRTDQEIGEVSAMLKDVSVTFGLHTIALCAENDDGQVRNSREPEYDFDNILKLIVRSEKNMKTGNPMIITDKVLVTKWRDSERGYTIRVEMEGRHCLFRDVTGPNA